MAISFTGRVVKHDRLAKIEETINKIAPYFFKAISIGPNYKESLTIPEKQLLLIHEGMYHSLCKEVLTDFRNSIEAQPELEKYQLPLEKNDYLKGNSYIGECDPEDPFYHKPICIKLDFTSALYDSSYLNSSDLLLGSLGHELGHFYVRRLGSFYQKIIHPIWAELLSDFMGGFLFGLDYDGNIKTRDLNLEGRKAYFPYLCETQNAPKIPNTKFGFVEILNGKHPFCASRVKAIEMGYNKGTQLINFPLPIGLTNNMAFVFNEFMRNYCLEFNNSKNLQDIAKVLENYNPQSKIYPPAPTFFVK